MTGTELLVQDAIIWLGRVSLGLLTVIVLAMLTILAQGRGRR